MTREERRITVAKVLNKVLLESKKDEEFDWVRESSPALGKHDVEYMFESEEYFRAPLDDQVRKIRKKLAKKGITLISFNYECDYGVVGYIFMAGVFPTQITLVVGLEK